MKRKHIEIRAVGERVEVIVDDYELFDYFDDVFTENGLEYQFISEEKREGRRFHKMHFGADVTQSRLREVVVATPQDEVERILQLKNSSERDRGSL